MGDNGLPAPERDDREAEREAERREREATLRQFRRPFATKRSVPDEPEPGTVVAELRVTYRRHNGAELTLPCCNIFRLRESLVDDYRIYMDVNPVFA